MMPLLRNSTRSTTHSSFTPLLRLLVVVIALKTSSIMGMTVPINTSGSGSSSSSTDNDNTNHGGNNSNQWHETASGIPTTGADWISLSQGQEFQPATFDDHTPETQAQLVRAQRRFLGYRDNFVDGTETYYAERSQAWRMLGVYIDCDAQDEEDDHDRKLNVNRKLEDKSECQRYMLWAGYIDLDYQGGGAGEYQYFNKYTQEWDASACEIHGNGRCAKLDCHARDTHFTLLGFFKNADYDDFFEQLFKHEGVCLWKNDEYDFMDAYRAVWPQYCTASTISYQGNYLYYDIKPTSNGEMGIGLYTDSACSEEYRGGKSKDGLLSQKNCGDDDNGDNDDCVNLDMDLTTFLEDWNSALDIFRVCVPCASFDIEDDDGDDHDDRRRKRRERALENEDGGNYNYDDDGWFQCDDEAGYTNVNQCMKFSTHTDLERASFEDVSLATQQNTVLNPNLAGIQTKGFSKVKSEYGFMTFSLIVLGSGTIFFAWATRRRRHRRGTKQNEAPLV